MSLFGICQGIIFCYIYYRSVLLSTMLKDGDIALSYVPLCLYGNCDQQIDMKNEHKTVQLSQSVRVHRLIVE